MALNAGSIVAALELDTGNFYAKLQEAQSSADGIGGKLKGFGDGIASLGKGLTLGVTAPLTALGTGIAKTSIDFESAMAGVRKTTDLTDKEFSDLTENIRNMSKELPASAVEIAGVAEAAGQLGIEKENILGFTRTMIDLGEATNMTSEEAANAFARFANITQMPQTEFENLGSVVVELGNNLATTESEIVEMGLRLAGVGNQVGMTEASIMGLSGALSSVGINAEAGGSAMSRVMQNINTEVLSSGQNLQGFAEISGMSAQEFANSWQAAPQQALTSFVEGLGRVKESGSDVTAVLAELGISGIREVDALLRLAGAGDLLADSFDMANKAWEENNALSKEAEQRYATTASQLAIVKNTLVDAGLTLGEIVVPYLQKGAEWVKGLAESFASLNPKTQETIVKFAGISAAIGPVLLIGGKLASGVGSIIGLLGNLSPAATLASGAIGGGSTAMLGFAGSLADTSLLLNPWIAGIAAAGVAAVGLAHYLMQDAVPAVDLFGDGISETTEKAVGAFLDLEQQATASLGVLQTSGMSVTEEMATGIAENINSMKEQVIEAYNTQEQEALMSLEQMLANTTQYTEEEKTVMIENARAGFEEKRTIAEEGAQRVNEILTTAAEENRTVTETEWTEINSIMEQMTTQGVEILSATQEEHKQILEEMKNQSTQISAEAASEMIKKSAELKEQTIKDAEEQYQKTVTAIKNMKTDGSKEAEEMKTELIKKAEEQKNETVKKAEEMHTQVVAEGKAQAGDLASAISSEDGTIMSNWEKMKQWFANNPIIRYIKTQSENVTVDNYNKYLYSENYVGNAHGTNYFGGGYSLVGEHGPELVQLPKGSKVFNNDDSKRLGGGGVTINNYYNISDVVIREEADIQKVSEEIERKQTRDLRARGLNPV